MPAYVTSCLRGEEGAKVATVTMNSEKERRCLVQHRKLPHDHEADFLGLWKPITDCTYGIVSWFGQGMSLFSYEIQIGIGEHSLSNTPSRLPPPRSLGPVGWGMRSVPGSEQRLGGRREGK